MTGKTGRLSGNCDLNACVVVPEDFFVGPSRRRQPTRAPLAEADTVTRPAAEELHEGLFVWRDPHNEQRAAQQGSAHDRTQVGPFDRRHLGPGDPYETDPA